MIIPSLLPVLAPIVVFFVIRAVAGPAAALEALGALLLGVIVAGLFVALSTTSGGGAWDNARTNIEDGTPGGNAPEPQRAALTAHTAGDPHQETGGPHRHRIIKLHHMPGILLPPALPPRAE